MHKQVVLSSEIATGVFAKQVAQGCVALQMGMNIHLLGTLGAGKTAFARGFIQGLGYSGRVKSPTYTLVEPYEVAGLRIYHFDLYRLADPEELEFIGIRDYVGSDVINLIEWPSKGAGMLSEADVEISIEILEDARNLKIEGYTELGNRLIQQL